MRMVSNIVVLWLEINTAAKDAIDIKLIEIMMWAHYIAFYRKSKMAEKLLKIIWNVWVRLINEVRYLIEDLWSSMHSSIFTSRITHR